MFLYKLTYKVMNTTIRTETKDMFQLFFYSHLITLKFIIYVLSICITVIWNLTS